MAYNSISPAANLDHSLSGDVIRTGGDEGGPGGQEPTPTSTSLQLSQDTHEQLNVIQLESPETPSSPRVLVIEPRPMAVSPKPAVSPARNVAAPPVAALTTMAPSRGEVKYEPMSQVTLPPDHPFCNLLPYLKRPASQASPEQRQSRGSSGSSKLARRHRRPAPYPAMPPQSAVELPAEGHPLPVPFFPPAARLGAPAVWNHVHFTPPMNNTGKFVQRSYTDEDTPLDLSTTTDKKGRPDNDRCAQAPLVFAYPGALQHLHPGSFAIMSFDPTMPYMHMFPDFRPWQMMTQGRPFRVGIPSE